MSAVQVCLPALEIRKIADVFRGGSPDSKDDAKCFRGNIPWIMIADLNKSLNKYISQTTDTATDAGVQKSNTYSFK